MDPDSDKIMDSGDWNESEAVLTEQFGAGPNKVADSDPGLIDSHTQDTHYITLQVPGLRSCEKQAAT